MTDRQRLVLALSITEINGVIEHLDATPGPYPPEQQELVALMLRLVLSWAPGASIVDTLAEARAYLTDNVHELEALLNEMAEEVDR